MLVHIYMLRTLGAGKGVLFREVSSVQECPHRERFHYIKYTDVPLYCYNIHQALQWYTVFNMY